MSKVVRVQDGDYKLLVGYDTTGNILLDTNPKGVLNAFGKVIINGDLEVYGNTSTVESTDLVIKDNKITLNSGETGEGVSNIISGIDIDRGTEPDVSFLWDENLFSRDPVTNLNLPGTFKFVDSNNNLIPIATNSINTFGENLALISNGAGVITVSGTADYEERILDYSKINVVFEITSISRLSNIAIVTLNAPHGLTDGDRIDIHCFPDSSFDGTSVPVTIVNDTSVSYNSPGFNILEISFMPGIGGTVRPNFIIDDDRIPNIRAVADYSRASLISYVGKKIQEKDTKVEVRDTDLSGVSEITFVVDGNQRSIINNTGLSVDNINIFENSITNFVNDNLRVNSILSLENKSYAPIATPGYVTLFSKTEPGTGGTGLYFVNTTGTDDELISKTKALLYSLIL